MRIAKTQAISTLQEENAKLEQQMAKCAQQATKLAGFDMGSLRGRSVTSAREKIRMHAAILEAHKAFYGRVLAANNKNKGLLAALPETSPGMLDTEVATNRRDAANQQISVLESQRQSALHKAQAINESIVKAAEVGSAGADASVGMANLDAIGGYYDALIDAQRGIVRLNEQVLEKAAQYDSESAMAYRSVDTSNLDGAVRSSGGFLAGRGWGDTSWALSAGSGLMGGVSKVLSGSDETKNLAEKLLGGEVGMEKSVLSRSAQGSTSVGDVIACGAVSGNLLGVSASVRPYDHDLEKGEDDGSPYVGVVARAEVYGAKGEAEASAGDLFHGHAEGQVLTGAVSGVLGGSLSLGAQPSLSLEADLVAEGSVLSSEGKAVLGTSDYNVNVRGEGRVLTGTAEAKLKVGSDGIEAKAGAEAYVATGEISGGITLFGVRFSAGLEGKVGGAGLGAQAKIDTSSIEGEVGIGLGLGAGVKVNVDWSGAKNAWSALGRSAEKWWNRLVGG